MFIVCVQTWVQSGLVFILNNFHQNDFTDVDILWNFLWSIEEQDPVVRSQMSNMAFIFLTTMNKIYIKTFYVFFSFVSLLTYFLLLILLFSSSIYSDLKKQTDKNTQNTVLWLFLCL